MVWTGILLLAVVGWTLFGTALVAESAQDELEATLASTWTESPAPEGAPTTIPDDTTSVTETVERETPQTITPIVETAGNIGDPVGRIQIARADVDHVVVEGVDPENLKKGPGHMPWTPLPGQSGNAVISAHRTTYGAPFYDLDLVGIGDEVIVETAIGQHTYTVREVLVVEPTDVWVTDPRPGAWLTLTTCTPRYSAAQRLIVVAELTSGPNFAALSSTLDPPRTYDTTS